jgi:hypothetical protein
MEELMLLELENRVEILEHKIKKLEGNTIKVVDDLGFETFKTGYLIGFETFKTGYLIGVGKDLTKEEIEIMGLKYGYLKWENEND